MINVSGGLPPEIQQQQQALNRQQQMAQLLMQQGQTMPSGQMVSGRYVAPSFFQYAAPLFQTYAGKSLARESDKEALALANKLRQGETEALADFMKTKQGKSAVPAPAGYELVDAGTPAVAPNPQAAYANLYADPRATPSLRDFARNKLFAEPEAFTLPEGSIRFVTMPDGSTKQIAAGGEKIRAPIQVDIGTHIEFRDALDPNKVLARVAKAKDGSGKDFGNALALRKEFNGEGIYKGYQEVKNAWSQINTGLNAKSPAGDLAAATKFMKLLDPTSVVRESELLMAMQASGALDRLYNYAQMRVAGTKLTPTQREDFRKLSDEFYQTSLNQYNEKFNEYKDIALRNNLNPDDIGKPDVFKPQTAPKKEEKPKTTVGQQLNVPAVKAPKFLGFEPTPTGQQ